LKNLTQYQPLTTRPSVITQL